MVAPVCGEGGGVVVAHLRIEMHVKLMGRIIQSVHQNFARYDGRRVVHQDQKRDPRQGGAVRIARVVRHRRIRCITGGGGGGGLLSFNICLLLLPTRPGVGRYDQSEEQEGAA